MSKKKKRNNKCSQCKKKAKNKVGTSYLCDDCYGDYKQGAFGDLFGGKE